MRQAGVQQVSAESERDHFSRQEVAVRNTRDTLALTTVFFEPDTGEIYDANIELNSGDRDDADFALGAADSDPSTTI